MKNKLIISIYSFFFLFVSFNLSAENLRIDAKNISIDKKTQVTIFKDEVTIITENNNIIKGEYAEYDKLKKFIIIKKDVRVIDAQKNTINTEYAEYDNNTKVFKSLGLTKINTADQYEVIGEDILFDNSKNFISSIKRSIITDKDKNQINLENFEYLIDENIFKSIGLIEIQDAKGNSYEFSQVYIDTKKKEIFGTDIKSFLNQKEFKIVPENKPRIFANSLQLDKKIKKFNKGIFTLCDYRKNDKCPPWSIQASSILHDNKKKTIYYENAVIKVYDIPIFYFPKLNHPDPTVDRRSGFLPPTLSNSKSLGSGVEIPYFWAISDDKNFTVTNKIFFKENPLLLGEYHQVFKDSEFITNFGYTEGYKKTSTNKKKGDKSHFFTNFVKSFKTKDGGDSALDLSIQSVSNDKYLKLYKVKSELVDYNTETLENSLQFLHQNDNTFVGFNTSIYETLKDNYNDKYELISELTFDKNLISNNRVGSLDLLSSLEAHNYDTNKSTNFVINELDWDFKEINFKSNINTKLIGNFKNINYETKNVNIYKENTTSEFYGALGILNKIDLKKEIADAKHFLTPKMLFRYSPGSMRKENNGFLLNAKNAFDINRLGNSNNYETGMSATIGLDYKINKDNQDFDFSVAQIINEKANSKMHSKTSLDEKLSDVVAQADYSINDKISLNYQFALDQNYKDLNYNNIGTAINLDLVKVNFDYLEENKHIGDQKYFSTKIGIPSKKTLIELETKRNLVTNSSEFYNLSYEYLNDCLRAGLVYRREFYKDSEIEPEDSLMFKITLTPFGNVNSPSFSK
jgi:LPS-assembly protein